MDTNKVSDMSCKIVEFVFGLHQVVTGWILNPTSKILQDIPLPLLASIRLNLGLK